MSSGESNQYGAGPSSDPNKRRRPNACDMCRKRKIRCDGNRAGTGKCSNCTIREWECIFGNFTAKGKYTGYIEALEVKVRRLESLIKRLLPNRDFTKEVGYELTRDNWMMPGVCGTSALDDPIDYDPTDAGVISTPAALIQTQSSFSTLGPDQAPPMTSIPEDGHLSDEEDSLTTKLQQLPVIMSAKPQDVTNYLGRSSAAGLLKTAVALCNRLAPHVDANSIFGRARRRPDWMDELASENPQAPYHFPDPDLLDELVDLYFLHVHTFAPVLHQSTFENNKRSGLHLRDRTFGGVLLLVCALAERFSHDSRVVEDGGEEKWHYFGWRWFSQVRLYDAARMIKPNSHLHGLQILCLGVMYGVSISHVHAWIHAGLGVRLALDIGAHKRRAYGTTPTVDDELYKRNFWMLVHLDRTLSSAMGRPCCIQEEDFDLDPPLCCDDQYLSHTDPRQVAKQPEDIPSYTSYFIWMLKLSQIHGLALRTLYASTKARAHYNFQGEDWITRTTAHLDSLLNNWADSVPEHLRWDAKRANDLFFCQSAHLYLLYHELRIMVHRQFLATLQPTLLSSPALTICMNAARSLVHLLNALLARAPERAGLVRWDAAYAGLVMLVGTGIARLHGFAGIDRKQTMADVDMMIAILRMQEYRWRCAGRYSDALEVFKAIGDEDKVGPAKQRKRRHDDIVSAQSELVHRETSLPSASFTQDHVLREALNAPSVFTSNPPSETVDARSLLPDATMPPSSGAFLGNINFGALFGFGNTNPDVMKTPLPAGLNGGTGMSTGACPSMDALGSEDWMGMSFDFGMGDWQWLTPTPEEAGHMNVSMGSGWQ